MMPIQCFCQQGHGLIKKKSFLSNPYLFRPRIEPGSFRLGGQSAYRCTSELCVCTRVPKLIQYQKKKHYKTKKGYFMYEEQQKQQNNFQNLLSHSQPPHSNSFVLIKVLSQFFSFLLPTSTHKFYNNPCPTTLSVITVFIESYTIVIQHDADTFSQPEPSLIVLFISKRRRGSYNTGLRLDWLAGQGQVGCDKEKRGRWGSRQAIRWQGAAKDRLLSGPPISPQVKQRRGGFVPVE